MPLNSNTSGDVWHQALSFFDPGGAPSGDLITLQVDPSAPTPTGLATASDMLLPNTSLADRLAHFPANLYDLRETSHLVRFMKVLLGDAGGGGLLKSITGARFQATIQGSHFYDLDGFYGAIFGASRNLDEILSVSTTATAQEWDQASVADASYRQRVFDLAAAINMGATYPGIQAAAEALMQTDVDIYEAWDLLDAYGTGGPGRTWADVEALGTWGAIESLDTPPALLTWSELEDRTVIGRTGTNSRAEVIVVPKKNYDQIAAESGQAEADRQRLEDQYSLIRVLRVIKPASVLLTVDPSGVALHREARISAVQADSNFWYVSTVLTPNPTLVSPNGTTYPVSIQQAIEGVLSSDTHEIPKPPWSIQQQARWSYAPEVTAVRAYSLAETGEAVVDPTDYGTVTYQDGTRETFSSDRGIMDPARALAARYASEGILVTSPTQAFSRPTGSISLLDTLSPATGGAA